MPYASIDALPAYVKKHPLGIQSRWRGIFNSVYQAQLKKGKTPKEAESAAFPIANSILK